MQCNITVGQVEQLNSDNTFLSCVIHQIQTREQGNKLLQFCDNTQTFTYLA